MKKILLSIMAILSTMIINESWADDGWSTTGGNCGYGCSYSIDNEKNLTTGSASITKGTFRGTNSSSYPTLRKLNSQISKIWLFKIPPTYAGGICLYKPKFYH